jgi:hypothetical protein
MAHRGWGVVWARPGRPGRGALGRVALLVPLLLGTLLAPAASAQVASFSIGITIGGPSSVTAGATNTAASLALVNNSMNMGPVTLTTISYHPSCADFNLACTAPEPGVFTLSPTATGAAGTGCAGVAFTVTTDMAGRSTFTPAAPVVLAAGGTCTIGFTFNTLRVPTTDADIGAFGVQTVRSAIIEGTGTANAGGTVNGTSRAIATITVFPVQPTIATQASPAVSAPGAAVHDVATVTGAPGVALTGTVTFELFGPADTQCAGPPVFTSTVPLGGNGVATSASFSPTQLGTHRFKARYNGDANNAPVTAVCNAANEAVSVVAPAYHALTPARILDTRTGLGGVSGPIAGGTAANVLVAGQGGVPASGVSAVVLNVTVTQPTAVGFLTLFPNGTALPLASSLNFTPGQNVPNLVVVKLGADGRVGTYNSAGSTHVLFDVAGWYSESDPGSASRYRAQVPARILDTRDGTGGGARLGPNQSLELQVAGAGGVPASGVDAAVLNIVATATTATSFVTAYPTGSPQPGVSNLNFDAGDTVANRAIVKLGTGGKVTIYNLAGGADIVVDVGGWYVTSAGAATGGNFIAQAPARILDTRDGTGGVSGIRPAATAVEVQVAGRGGVPASGVGAVVLNVTATQPAGLGFLTLFPSGNPLPLASDLNFEAGETRPNLAVVQLSPSGKVTLYVSTATHVIFDVEGWFNVAQVAETGSGPST